MYALDSTVTIRNGCVISASDSSEVSPLSIQQLHIVCLVCQPSSPISVVLWQGGALNLVNTIFVMTTGSTIANSTATTVSGYFPIHSSQRLLLTLRYA